MADLTPDARSRGRAWALRTLDEAAERYPDIGAIAERARGPQNLLDRLIREGERRAREEGHDEIWLCSLLPTVVSVWLGKAGLTARADRRAASTALDDRRNDIIKAAEELMSLLRRNEAQLGVELGLDLRALPVSIRFPGLMQSLHGLAQWARRDAQGQVSDPGGPLTVQFFVERVDDALGFQLGHEVVADLWRLLAEKETSSNAVRMARNRTKPSQ